jgi:hypothetical protein
MFTAGEPALLDDVLAAFPRLGAITWESLRAAMSERTYRARSEPRDVGDVRQYRSVVGHAFLDEVLGPESPPYQICHAPVPPLDFPTEVRGRRFLLSSSTFFVGGRRNLTRLHYDLWHGLLVQLRGAKRVTLFSPESAHDVYARSPFARDAETATDLPAALDRVDKSVFVRLASTPRCEFRLNEGQAVYIPPFFWHEVECLEPSVALGVRFMPTWLEAARSPLFPLVVAQARWNLQALGVRARERWRRGRPTPSFG